MLFSVGGLETSLYVWYPKRKGKIPQSFFNTLHEMEPAELSDTST